MTPSAEGDAGHRAAAGTSHHSSSRPRDLDVSVSVFAAVDGAIESVYRDAGRPRCEVTPGSLLGGELGLDSLDLAQGVGRLERSLGVDPFRTGRAGATPIRTVENLISIYAAELATPAVPPTG